MTLKALTIRKNTELVEVIGISNDSQTIYFDLDVSSVPKEELVDIEDFIEDGIWGHDCDACHAEGTYGIFVVAIEDFEVK